MKHTTVMAQRNLRCVVELIECTFRIRKHQSVCFTRIGDFTWRVSDCEELFGKDY